MNARLLITSEEKAVFSVRNKQIGDSWSLRAESLIENMLHAEEQIEFVKFANICAQKLQDSRRACKRPGERDQATIIAENSRDV